MLLQNFNNGNFYISSIIIKKWKNIYNSKTYTKQPCITRPINN